jgi:hypothetical protein
MGGGWQVVGNEWSINHEKRRADDDKNTFLAWIKILNTFFSSTPNFLFSRMEWKKFVLVLQNINTRFILRDTLWYNWSISSRKKWKQKWRPYFL